MEREEGKQWKREREREREGISEAVALPLPSPSLSIIYETACAAGSPEEGASEETADFTPGEGHGYDGIEWIEEERIEEESGFSAF
jgi:hypothetical protein